MVHGRILAGAAATLMLAGCNQGAGDAAASGPDAATQAMLDRIAIEDMVVDYYAHLGAGDPAAFDAYFTEGAILDVNGNIATGREEIMALYEAVGEDETSASNIAGPFRMLLSNPVISVAGDTATARFIWTGIGNPAIDAPPQLIEQGREYDRLEKVDGAWKFSHRVVIADSGLPAGQYEAWERRADFSFAD